MPEIAEFRSSPKETKRTPAALIATESDPAVLEKMDTLSFAERHPYPQWLDSDEQVLQQNLSRSLDGAGGERGVQHVGFRMSARTAYDAPLPSIITRTLENKISAEDHVYFNVEIAVTEAIANGILHGCLELESPEDRLAEAFTDAIDERIESSEFGGREIAVLLEISAEDIVISVCNEGPAFTPPEEIHAETPFDAYRGLSLIQSTTGSLEFLDHGRCLKMKFNR